MRVIKIKEKLYFYCESGQQQSYNQAQNQPKIMYPWQNDHYNRLCWNEKEESTLHVPLLPNTSDYGSTIGCLIGIKFQHNIQMSAITVVQLIAAFCTMCH